MTWRAYTYSSGFVISRDGDIVGDTAVIRNEIIEDLSREITLILKKSTQVLESDMKELVSDEELVIFLESLKIDLIGRAKVNLMNELKMQFEIELKKRILNHDSLWDQVHQKREKYGDKYSDIGKKLIREYLDRAFESKEISYDRYYTDNLEKAKNEISDKLLGSLNGNVIA
ncbi:hypothetical protein [Paenibacillus sp. FSL M7-0420]|uniref:hypothetical protein n=1 Tax=Paenibacillus sp. FSL M7-0420 TaxID=2921609 RepID=UPI0030F6FD3D